MVKRLSPKKNYISSVKLQLMMKKLSPKKIYISCNKKIASLLNSTNCCCLSSRILYLHLRWISAAQVLVNTSPTKLEEEKTLKKNLS